jgi:hypothetical protein
MSSSPARNRWRRRTIGSVLLAAVAVGAVVSAVMSALPVNASRAGGLVRAAGTPAALRLTPASATVERGQTLTIDVRLDTGDGEAVNALEADLSYSATILDYQSTHINGTVWGITASSTGGDGKVSIQVGSTTPVSGDQLVATVTFTAAAAGDANIAFASTSAAVGATTNTNVLGATSTVPGAGGPTSDSGTPSGQTGAPAGGGPPNRGASRPTAVRARLRLLGWRGRALRVRVGCPSSAPSRCTVALTLRTLTGRVLGRRTVRLARGATRAARLTLPVATARRLHGRTLRLLVRTTTSAGVRTTIVPAGRPL